MQFRPTALRRFTKFMGATIGASLVSLALYSSTYAYLQDEIGNVEGLRAEYKKAQTAYQQKKLSASVESIDRCTAALIALVEKSTPREIAELRKIHQQLLAVQDALSLQGADLMPLPAWEELMANKQKPNSGSKPNGPTTGQNKGSDGEISFSKDIAPWMSDQCGRCHIQKSSGNFSMATFDALMNGVKGAVVLFPGDPVASRIVETIETGDMPRGGGKVSPENLAKLKKWIEQGAKFDGPKRDMPINTLAKVAQPNAAPMAEKEKMVETAAPTGKETVSFARDIAPILTANCNGCHYEGMRPMGGLAFNNYSQLLKGGDSGAIVAPKDAAGSLLVKKIRGMAGQRMPAGGRPALSEENIKLISTWIDEGAVFDGENKESRLDSVIAKAWASKANHAEMMERRIARARDKWQTAAPKSKPAEASDDHFHVLGNVSDESAKKLLEIANSAEAQVKKLYSIRGKDPLIKGGITLFALKQRYDYSEFGTMLESRSLPVAWSSHWRSEVLDSYVAIVYDNSDPKIIESSLVQQLSSLWVASHEGTPKWFADGAGRQALAQSVGANDVRVQTWMKQLPESMKQLENLKRFLDGGINDEDSATIGFGIVRFMNEGTRKRQYDTLIRSLASGTPFDQASLKTIGPMETFLQQLLGRKK